MIDLCFSNLLILITTFMHLLVICTTQSIPYHVARFYVLSYFFKTSEYIMEHLSFFNAAQGI